MAWIVYTLWDKYGDVIYAGITTDVTRRLIEHGKEKPWFIDIVKVKQVPFPNEREARDAEYSIICAERPRWNRRGTDICPRCRERLRARAGKAPYCEPCQTAYNLAWRRSKGITPKLPPTVTCPRCGGIKDPGPSYCRACKSDINRAYRNR